jgi:N-methylhydantoinase B
MGALAKACPEKIPAASQGTMNNLSIGGWDPYRKRYFTYYETIGGGTGASQTDDGISAIHSHMTNTLNTPVEALEYTYPLQVARYTIREGSGGTGVHVGGNGITREIKLLTSTQVTLLTERRKIHPYGLAGGTPGAAGENKLVHNDEEKILPGKGSFYTSKGDRLVINTPGGGGYGRKAD